MILSNAGIQLALDSGDVVIDPEPVPREGSLAHPHCPYDTCSVNLRLDSQLAVPIPGKPMTFDLRRGGVAAFLAEIYKPKQIDPDGGYALQPHHFVLGQTMERVSLPIREGRPSYAARIEGRSSFARIGLLVHFTAPTIHAGFAGTIALEMINLAAYPITLYPGMEVCQLLIEPVASTPFENPSGFQGQGAPTGQKRD
jgi:dCTP deaminase